MRAMTGILGILLFLCACKGKSGKDKKALNGFEKIAYPAGMEGVDKWFSAWEFVSAHKLNLPPAPAPAILLYDDNSLYTTSAISAPDSAVAFTGPALFGQQLPWKQRTHHGMLTIPDGQQVPVGLMSFAASDKNGNPFFVMAAPAFWKTAGVESKEVGLDHLMTAVFLHEFTHTRQQKGMGAMVDSIEKKQAFKDPELSDDIVQHLFQKDSNYVRSFRAEVDKFYAAALATDTIEIKRLAREGLAMLKKRQAVYFKNDKAVLKKLDDIFLTMEGLGQFVGCYWLMHPKGAKIHYLVAVEGMRRKRNQWSQEEGLALFLILDQITKPDWQKDMFGDKPTSIVELLEALVKK